MSDITLDSVKDYLRVDFDDDNDYITQLIKLSKDYIYQQSGVEYNSNDEVYKQAVLFCVAHFYCNRQPLTEKAVTNTPFTFDSLVKHISLRGEYNAQ